MRTDTQLRMEGGNNGSDYDANIRRPRAKYSRMGHQVPRICAFFSPTKTTTSTLTSGNSSFSLAFCLSQCQQHNYLQAALLRDTVNTFVMVFKHHAMEEDGEYR